MRMTNYITRLINYLTNPREDEDSMVNSHIEHDVDLKKEKAEARKKLEEFLRLGVYPQQILD